MKITNETAKQSWEDLGEWWDKQLGDGDFFHNNLIFPHLLKMIRPKKNDNILDLACGNGALSRILATHGANVLAIDFCESFLKKAKERAKAYNLSIEYHLVDLSDIVAMQHILLDRKFNKAVCSLAIHAIVDISPLIKALPKMLTNNGTFSLALLHPYFNSGEIQIRLPTDYSNDEYGVLRKSYIKPIAIMRKGKQLQPVPHPNFHRSLSHILNQFFSVGFVLDQCPLCQRQ